MPNLKRQRRSTQRFCVVLVLLSMCSTGAWQSGHEQRITFRPRCTASQRVMVCVCAAYTNGDGGGSGVGSGTTSQGLEETKAAATSTNGASNLQQKKVDYTGAGTLGDIMSEGDKGVEAEIPFADVSKSSPSRSGLVTQDGGTLEARFGITSPLDRMALTANGNLQRLFSSYYDAPVHVLVDRCDLISLPGTWDRVVHLTVHNQTFCTAASVITVHDPECRLLVQSGKVGIGQLFRHLDKLPTFTLLDAGRSRNDALWRLYELQCNELSCRIREEFVPHAWDIVP